MKGRRHDTFRLFYAPLQFFYLLDSQDVELVKKGQNSIICNSQEFDFRTTPTLPSHNNTREQIDLIVEDFETTAGDWDASSDGTNGWMTNTEYFSETTSMHSPDYLPVDENGEPTYKAGFILSTIFASELGDGETMHFDFMLNLDLPGANVMEILFL